METKPPRIWVVECFRCTASREDGRFFAALRMTCVAIAVGETYPSAARQTVILRRPCLPCPAQAGARPTKDLLQHRMTLERVLSFARS